MSSLDGVISGRSEVEDCLAAKPYSSGRISSPVGEVYNILKRKVHATIDQLVSTYKTRKDEKDDATLLPFDYSTGRIYRSLPEMLHNRFQYSWSNASERVWNLITSYLGLGAYSKKKNYGSSRYGGGGFTLVELLVTISAIALLTAILMPSLHRARRQAKAVACQSKLKQWNTAFAMNEVDVGEMSQVYGGQDYWWLWGHHVDKDAYLCPMAMKLGPSFPNKNSPPPSLAWRGSKFAAWGYEKDSDWGTITCSYGFSISLSSYVGGVSNMPVFLDSTNPVAGLKGSSDPPPEYDDQHYGWDSLPDPNMWGMIWASGTCINRHSEGINILFLDGHVRKVGLKELWTLKWHREFDTTGPWTRAGGVQPGDWPEWMRKFPDY